MAKINFDDTSNNVFEPSGTKFLETCSRWFLIFCVFLAFIIVYIHIVYEAAPVSGSSMQNTLNQYGDEYPDKVIINIFLKYSYGDIIVVDRSSADNVRSFHIKRVIGLAGDKINIVEIDGKYYVERNGKVLEEKYIKSRAGMALTHSNFENYLKVNPAFKDDFDEEGNFVVPKGTVFVLGDNRGESEDSSKNGPYRTKDVVGKVQYVVPSGVSVFRYIMTNLFRLTKETDYLYRNVD